MKTLGYIGITPYYIMWKKEKDEVGLQATKLQGCDELIEETAAWTSDSTMLLSKVIKSLTYNDELVICDLKYIAKNTKQLISRIELIESKGAKLRVLNIEDSLLGHFTALKKFESYIASSKILQGKDSSIKDKKRKVGRKELFDSHDRNQIKNDWRTGEKITEIALRKGVSTRTISRIINDKGKYNE
jgi:DNA invertase Pin-like site-specific DNA recombinase